MSKQDENVPTSLDRIRRRHRPQRERRRGGESRAPATAEGQRRPGGQSLGARRHSRRRRFKKPREATQLTQLSRNKKRKPSTEQSHRQSKAIDRAKPSTEAEAIDRSGSHRQSKAIDGSGRHRQKQTPSTEADPIDRAEAIDRADVIDRANRTKVKNIRSRGP